MSGKKWILVHYIIRGCSKRIGQKMSIRLRIILSSLTKKQQGSCGNFIITLKKLLFVQVCLIHKGLKTLVELKNLLLWKQKLQKKSLNNLKLYHVTTKNQYLSINQAKWRFQQFLGREKLLFC